MVVDDIELIDSLHDDVAKVIDVLRSAPGEPVPSCPGWSVSDLVDHHGGVLRWATQILETGEPVVEEFRAPSAVTALVDWYSEGAAGFVDVVRSVNLDRACWTFGRPPV